MFRSKFPEKQLVTIRRLLKVAEEHAQHIAALAPGSLHHAEVEDAIDDGEYLLKQLGGVAARTAPVGPSVAHGQCLA